MRRRVREEECIGRGNGVNREVRDGVREKKGKREDSDQEACSKVFIPPVQFWALFLDGHGFLNM